MKFYSCKYILLFLVFSLCRSLLFSQASHEKVFFQFNLGNTTYLHPTTETGGFAPCAEVILLRSFNKSDSLKRESYFLAGITYAHDVQTYNVLWGGSNSNKFVKDNFYTNEFLFNLGGLVKFKLAKTISLNVGLGLQVGPNYTYTNDPYGNVTTYRLKAVQDPHLIQSMATKYTWQYNSGIWGQKEYNWEYFQFYAFGMIQMEAKISKKTAFILGVKPRVSFYKNELSEEVDSKDFNHAAIKMYLNLGLQVKLFK